MMKKMLLVLSTALLCVSAVGCGSKNETAQTTVAETTVAETTVAETTAAETTTEAESKAEETTTAESTEAEDAVGKYTVYNQTGEKVTDLYVYEVGSEDKGENLAGDGLAADATLDVTYEAKSDATLVLEFKTESGYEASFETLHIEEAPISLLSVDAMTGATPISFAAPQ